MTDRRKGTMSDEARALAELQRRRDRASSEPTADAFDSDDDHFTPVSTVIERAADLTDRERNLLRYVWTHTANMEMRARKRSDSQDSAQLARRIDDLETSVVDISGKTGSNGKLGTLKARVDAYTGRAWAVLLLLLGGIAGAAVKLIIVGRAYGELETEVAANKARIQLLERVVFFKSFPAMPDKELLP